MDQVEIEAQKMFDLYYEYCKRTSFEILQQFLESAYRLNARLEKSTYNNQSLFDIDEFLVIKLLRNFFVHDSNLDGKVWYLDPRFTSTLKMDLSKVCLIEKKIIHKAIHAESVLPNEDNERYKTAKVRSLLISIDNYYNFEPIIYNFTVKVYEKLLEFDVNILGEGFQVLSIAYNRETNYKFSHYVKTDDISLKDYNINTLTPFLMSYDEFTSLPSQLNCFSGNATEKEDNIAKKRILQKKVKNKRKASKKARKISRKK